MTDQKTVQPQVKAAGDTSFDRLAATLAFEDVVTKVHSVSPNRARTLSKIGITRVRDLLTHFPRRYIDMSHVQTVAKAVVGELCTVVGVVHDIQLKTPKPRMKLVEIALTDASGLLMVTCFRQPWLMDTYKPGMRIAVSGKIEFNYGFKRMTNPFIEEIDESFDAETGFIIPVHSASGSITTAWMRRLIANALDLTRGSYDPLPLDLRLRYRLPSRQSALGAMHFPQHMNEVDVARRRLVYEEVLLLELYLMTEAAKRAEGKTPHIHTIDGVHMRALIEHLPFTLTEEQTAAKKDLLREMTSKKSANHMVLGDVGTGKTIIAAFGFAACADTGTQACMMAPTEILARQYGQSLGVLLEKAGITFEILTGSTPENERAAIVERLAQGTVDVVFGTHALLEDDVVMRQCSFVVVDEQHRFGVEQRAKLLAKGEAVDALYLTATPIPRSLALALYGDLTLSYIKQRPQNIAGNTTKLYTLDERGHAYDAARAALQKGRQVYVVCPLVTSHEEKPQHKEGEGHEAYEYASVCIEDDRDLDNDDLKAATTLAERLQGTVFIDYTVGLLHGRMNGTEKAEVMQRFREGKVDVLVATTVIEVGVDVPNAAVMIIEDAERFGLAQLHQLRGRVGRGEEPGEAYLISGSKAPAALSRLAAMEKTEDGFELASYDLSLRREGDILGNRQHGASVLKLVNVVRDTKIIEAAHSDATAILLADPLLESDVHRPLNREMRTLFKDIKKTIGG